MKLGRNSKGSTTSTVFILLLLIPHCKPEYFNYVPFFDALFNVSRILSALVIFLLYFYHIFYGKRLDRNKTFIITVLFLYYFDLIFSTLYNHTNLYIITIRLVSQLSVFFICSYYASSARNNLISAVFYMGEIMVYTNLATIIFFPKGLYISQIGFWRNWLLGYKNQFLPYYIGFYLASYLYRLVNKSILRTRVLIVSMFISLLLVNSTTSIIVFALFSLLIFLIRYDYLAKLINSLVLTIINVISYFAIIYLQVADWFSFIVVGVFNKDITFGGRTQLWATISGMIYDHFLFGNGCMSDMEMISKTGIWWAVHAHNLVVQTLFEGGIVNLILFLSFNFIILRNLYKNRYSYVAQVVSIGIFILYIACITEVYTNAMIFVLYGFASAICDLIELDNDNIFRRKIRFVWKRNLALDMKEQSINPDLKF